MSTVYVYKRQVDDSRYVQLLDEHSGRLIFNCTKKLAENRAASTSAKADARFREAYTLDVNMPYTRFELDGDYLAWWNDMTNSELKMKRQFIILVQYACVIAHKLESGADILVYSQTGRSSSPSAIAVFFILFRGYSRDQYEIWLQEAFPTQRSATPQVTTRGRFPDFKRFHLDLDRIYNCRHQEEKHYYKLIEGMCLFEKSYIQNLSDQLHLHISPSATIRRCKSLLQNAGSSAHTQYLSRR